MNGSEPMPSAHTVTMLNHGRIELALHHLSSGIESGAPLLLLHSLGARTTGQLPAAVSQQWAGPVFGLDFTGHGLSSCPRGGGYSAELLMADADTALREIGPAVVVGSGLGGYVGLLVAGAAAGRVIGVAVTGGSGLAGGGVRPGSESIAVPPHRSDGTTPDPFALVELSTDLRPPHYIASFVRQFVSTSPLEQPVSVCTAARPQWLASVVEEYGVATCVLTEALENFAV
jgi:pimeloyl-ACP methyl ester carboxylesterase